MPNHKPTVSTYRSPSPKRIIAPLKFDISDSVVKMVTPTLGVKPIHCVSAVIREEKLEQSSIGKNSLQTASCQKPEFEVHLTPFIANIEKKRLAKQVQKQIRMV
jgi:hypothetical protein